MKHRNGASGRIARFASVAALIVVGACGSGNSQENAIDVMPTDPPVSRSP